MIRQITLYSEIGGFRGGVERFIFQAAQALKAAGIGVSGVFEQQGEAPERFAAAFDRVSYTAEDVEKFCRTSDLLWIHKCSDLQPLEAAASAAKIRTVFYVHDHDYYCFRRHKYFPVRRIVCPLREGLYCGLCGKLSRSRRDWSVFLANLAALRRADAVFAGSDYMLSNLEKNGLDSRKLAKLEPLMDLAVSDTESAEERRDGEILYVGQLVRGKGVDLLLRALKLLESPRWHLTVVGTGDDLEYCRSLAKELRIDGKVRFRGFVLNPGKYYARAMLSVFPSRWPEPFGMTGPEAMAYQVPVAAFDVGGVSEWLHHRRNGLLVPPGNVPALARAIDELLCNRNRAIAMGEAGAEELKKFTRERFVEKFLRNLEDIIK